MDAFSPEDRLPITPAAAYLGITPQTLRRHEADGLIHPETTVGGHRRYRVADLDEFRRRYMTRPASA